MKRTILLLTFVVTVSCMHAQRMLTLEECRNLAIQNNKELQISGEKIKMADNEKKAAFTKYFPQLSANGAYMWNQGYKLTGHGRFVLILELFFRWLGPITDDPTFDEWGERYATFGCAEYLGG